MLCRYYRLCLCLEKFLTITVRSSTAVFPYPTQFIKLLDYTFRYPVIWTLLDPQKYIQENRWLTLPFTCSEITKFAACKLADITVSCVRKYHSEMCTVTPSVLLITTTISHYNSKSCRMTQCPVTFTARSALQSQFASLNVLEVRISTVQHRTNIICKTLTALCHVCSLWWLWWLCWVSNCWMSSSHDMGRNIW